MAAMPGKYQDFLQKVDPTSDYELYSRFCGDIFTSVAIHKGTDLKRRLTDLKTFGCLPSDKEFHFKGIVQEHVLLLSIMFYILSRENTPALLYTPRGTHGNPRGNLTVQLPGLGAFFKNLIDDFDPPQNPDNKKWKETLTRMYKKYQIYKYQALVKKRQEITEIESQLASLSLSLTSHVKK